MILIAGGTHFHLCKSPCLFFRWEAKSPQKLRQSFFIWYHNFDSHWCWNTFPFFAEALVFFGLGNKESSEIKIHFVCKSFFFPLGSKELSETSTIFFQLLTRFQLVKRFRFSLLVEFWSGQSTYIYW